mmetsp:Transcript_8131/g.21248  ORF Transcript_8131/g.21248 Transcript_8131/m.21248 type:complete len:201 (-) Transcript_8131:445-1047(-)
MLTYLLAVTCFVVPHHVPTEPTSIGRPLIDRRSLLKTAAAAAVAGAMPAMVTAASPSPQQILKSRAVYGSRVFRLQNASPDMIIDDKNVFTLFITGVYSAAADKPIKTQLVKLEKTAIAAATKKDEASARAAIKEFIMLAKIEELDMKPGSYYNAKSPCDRAGLQCGYQYEGYLGSRNDDDLEKAARVAETLKVQSRSEP